MELLRFNTQQKYLIFDFETENLRLTQKNRAWQLGYMVCDINKIHVIQNRYIWWDDFKISEGAAKATRFDYNGYKNKAEDPKIVLEEFWSHLNNPELVCVGHNLLNFDIYINNIMRRELGFKNDFSYINRTIDTNSLARAIKKDIKQVERDKWYETFLRLSNFVEKGLKTSLTTLGKENNIVVDYDNLHDANEDIKLNYLVFKKLLWQIEI